MGLERRVRDESDAGRGGGVERRGGRGVDNKTLQRWMRGGLWLRLLERFT